MELKDFVTETLTQLIEGVHESQRRISDGTAKGSHDGKINPHLSTEQGELERKGYRVSTSGQPVQNVEFDVAVIVNEAVEAKAGAGLLVAAIGLGVKGAVETKDTSVHHIKFAVPIALPRS